MKKVLIITYNFPPSPAIGSVRLGGLAKYLPEFGWEPIFLTPELPGDPDPQFVVIQTKDHDILRHWREKIGRAFNKGSRQKQKTDQLKRSKPKYIKPILHFLKEVVDFPDSAKSWYRFAVEAGNKILQHESIDAMISSSKPETCHLIAKKLKAKWNIPWIADFRDPWTQNYRYSIQHNILRGLMEKRLELQTLSSADTLVTVTRIFAELLKTLHKTKQVYEIPNGFDPIEMKQISCKGLTSKFTITHTGSLYSCMRDPSNLFQAMRELIAEESIDPSDVQIRFYNQPEACLEKLIRDYGVQQITKQHGFVAREVSLEKQRESQLLLLLHFANLSAPGTRPAKVYEYLSTQRPIVATGKTGGVIEELLNETHAGVYAATVDDIKNFIKKCYAEYKSKGKVIYTGKRSKINKYSHREMAKKFSLVLQQFN